jgi:hypothetical protein
MLDGLWEDCDKSRDLPIQKETAYVSAFMQTG